MTTGHLAHLLFLIIASALLAYQALVCILESFLNAHALMQMRMRDLGAKIKSRQRDRARRQGDVLRAIILIAILIDLWL